MLHLIWKYKFDVLNVEIFVASNHIKSNIFVGRESLMIEKLSSKQGIMPRNSDVDICKCPIN